MGSYELGVIGAGNMAEAILRGVVSANFLPPQQIIASDCDAARRSHIADAIGVTVTDDNPQAAACEHVMLAVKPQGMADVLQDIRSAVAPDAVVISIAAGISTAALDEGLGGRGRIVRIMPNTPMVVGAGMSALCAGPRAGEAELQWARQLFTASGKAVIVDEAMMDAVTAVSGSGPAYLFYLVEAMTDAGVAEGLAPDVARLLAGQTCLGASQLLMESGEQAQELRRRVTSPGGTTQRAIETMEADNVKEKLVAAIRAAAQRSRELGQ